MILRELNGHLCCIVYIYLWHRVILARQTYQRVVMSRVFTESVSIPYIEICNYVAALARYFSFIAGSCFKVLFLGAIYETGVGFDASRTSEPNVITRGVLCGLETFQFIYSGTQATSIIF